MTIRVKLVIISKIAGASERTVSRMMICIAAEKLSRRVRSGSCGIENGVGFGVEGAAAVVGISIGACCASEIRVRDKLMRTAKAQADNRIGLTRASILIASLKVTC